MTPEQVAELIVKGTAPPLERLAGRIQALELERDALVERLAALEQAGDAPD
jgi:hypothetical protein